MGKILIDLTNGLEIEREITEGFVIDNFDSKKENMWLVSRSDPTPSEKEIKENLAFVQGSYDFSFILGERIFDNRPLSYSFQIYERDYGNRKIAQIKLQNTLMKKGILDIYDTAKLQYHYRGKCVSVNVEDDHDFGRLIATIEFDCYPFMIGNLEEGHDIWDEFNFELDVSQETEFDVNGNRTINLINVGSNGVSPIVEASGPIIIQVENKNISFPQGSTKTNLFRLLPGENSLTITGHAQVNFVFYKEMI